MLGAQTQSERAGSAKVPLPESSTSTSARQLSIVFADVSFRYQITFDPPADPAGVETVRARMDGCRGGGGGSGGATPAVGSGGNGGQTIRRELNVTGVEGNTLVTGRQMIDIIQEAVGDDPRDASPA